VRLGLDLALFTHARTTFTKEQIQSHRIALAAAGLTELAAKGSENQRVPTPFASCWEKIVRITVGVYNVGY